MKNKLHRSITALMAFLVLFSSTGFALVEHQCMMRGKSVQLVTSAKSSDAAKKGGTCCAKSRQLKETKGTFFKKTSCCKESHKFEKLEVVTSGAQSIAKILKVWTGDTIWFATSFVFLRAEWTLPPLTHFPDISFSSLLHGRGMLIFIQSFLI